ncbi:MAG: hypothetical protein U0793_31050 [Gemmataceae bacterium]
MPGCVLHVEGKDFDVATFLDDCTLAPYMVFHKGEPFRKGKNGIRDASGFSCLVSDSDGNLSEEFEDAIGFLTKHRESLLRLACLPTVQSKTLDFGYYSRLSDKYFMQSDTISLDLLRLVSQLGIEIELSLYARFEAQVGA